jgi:hypothetical protein
MLERLIIQPFSLHYDCNDFHIFFLIHGHPDYESMEAMIQEREEGGVLVRSIITRNDKTQIDHLNDPEMVALYKERGLKREVHYAPMQYTRAEVDGRMHIRLGFSSSRGEDIVLEGRSMARASARYAHLVDPLGHSGSISLPVMYPERSTLCGEDSLITINGKELGGERDEAFGSSGSLKGFFSENFRIGVFRAGNERFQVRQAPGSLRAGEKWVYASGSRMRCYEIVGTRDGVAWLEGENERMIAERTEDGIALRRVTVLSSSRARSQSDFSLSFEPGLPISTTADGQWARAESDFSISIDDDTALITGRATSERDRGTVHLLLSPDRPGWATDMKVATAVRREGETLVVGTEVRA